MLSSSTCLRLEGFGLVRLVRPLERDFPLTLLGAASRLGEDHFVRVEIECY